MVEITIEYLLQLYGEAQLELRLLKEKLAQLQREKLEALKGQESPKGKE